MVPHPTLLLAVAVALALVGWGGYRHGVQTADDACTARAAQAAHTAAVAARLDAEAEPQINLMRPSECLAPCPQLPTPTDADELAVTIWTFDLIDAAAECRRMHETCRHSKD